MPPEGASLTYILFDELHHFPQRFIAGLPDPREDSMQTPVANGKATVSRNMFNPVLSVYGSRPIELTTKQVTELASTLLSHDINANNPRNVGKTDAYGPSIGTGYGDTEALICKPTNDKQAARNLNFAIANLAAYNWWEKQGREEAKAQAEAEAKAKAEEARKVKLEQAEKARVAAELKGAIQYFNKLNSTNYASWDNFEFYRGRAQRQATERKYVAAWKAINPHPASIIMDGGISAAAVSAQDILNQRAAQLGRAMYPGLNTFAPQTFRL